MPPTPFQIEDERTYQRLLAMLPPTCSRALDDYIQQHRPTGGFLRSVITNDLKGAVYHADDTNKDLLPVYVTILYNHAPGACWGSQQAYDAWVKEFTQ